MITIEDFKDTHQKNLENVKIAYQQMVNDDLNFWKQEMKRIFDETKEINILSWKQGFFYNDESHAFSITDFTINEAEIQENGSYFSPSRGYSRNQEVGKITVEGQESVNLNAAAQAIGELIIFMYENFGKRHFADTFGKKSLVTFSKEGLLIEDYDDYDALDYGELKDLF